MQARWMRNVLGIAAGAVAGLVVSLPAVTGANGLLPIISFRAPAQNQMVGGNVVFYVTADSDGIVGLRFRIDGQNLGSEIVSGTCTATWDSKQAGDGLHTIEAIGRDQYGNLTLAQPVTVLVSNPPYPSPTPAPAPTPGPPPAVTITAPVPGVTVSGGAVSISATFPAETPFLTYYLLSPETNTVRLTTRGPDLGRLQTSASFTIDVSAVPPGAYDLQVVGRYSTQTEFSSPRVRLNVGAAPTPTPTPTPAPAPTLSMTLATTGGRDYSVTANLKLGGVALPGVRVTFVVTSPQGTRWTYSATTTSVGTALIQAKLSPSNPRGTYKVTATASASGLSATATGAFVY